MSGETMRSGISYEKIGDGRRANTGIFAFKKEAASALADVNELRKIMLRDLSGIAVGAFSLAVIIDGREEKVVHRYCALDNMKEDTAILIRNLRKIVVKTATFPMATHSDYCCEYAFETFDFYGATKLDITCGELQSKNPSLQFVNIDQHVLTLVRETPEQEVQLNLRLFFEERAGFIKAASNEGAKGEEPGVIRIDAQHSPVVRCAIRENKDKVFMEIETNGAVAPEESLIEALERFNGQKNSK